VGYAQGLEQGRGAVIDEVAPFFLLTEISVFAVEGLA
jgi:hypothetical protein